MAQRVDTVAWAAGATAARRSQPVLKALYRRKVFRWVVSRKSPIYHSDKESRAYRGHWGRGMEATHL